MATSASRALGRHRFDQARIVILDVADPRAHGPAGHLVRGERPQQLFKRGRLRRFFAEPNRPGCGFQDHGHAVMELCAQLVRRGSDDGEGTHPLARRRFPVLPQTRQRHQAPVGERVRRPVVRRVQGRDGWRCIQNPGRRANAADRGTAASDTVSVLYIKYRIRITFYSAAIRSQVISRCSSLSPVRRGGGMRTIRSPSKRTPRT
jgi:hypothetical protein